MDIVFATSYERKRAKKEKLEEKQKKFQKWETGWKEKQRTQDKKKVKKVQKQRAKEESKKTSFEKNAPKYEIWANKDDKGKMLMDRYQMHRKTPETPKKNKKKEEITPTTPKIKASACIESKLPPKKITSDTLIYTPSTSSPIFSSDDNNQTNKIKNDIKMHPGTALPRPSTFSSATVELRYKNNVCYWPSKAVTLENLRDRFDIKKPALRLASVPKGPLAIKFKPQPDGSYQVQGGQSYVIFNIKDKSSSKIKGGNSMDDKVLTYEEKVLRFLTMAKFSRGIILPSSMGTSKMIKEESFEFTTEGRFAYREFKGYKDVDGSLKQQIMLVGKYKFKNKHKFILLTFDKLKKIDKGERNQDKLEEKKQLYCKFFIPGDGTLQCYNDQSIRFK